MPRFIYIAGGIGVLLIIILILALAGVGRKAPESVPVTLEFWGIEDEVDAWRGTIDYFQKQYPHITVNYRRFPADTYEATFVNRLAEGRGPDVFLMPDSWILKHRDKIFSLPAASNPFKAADMSRMFVDDPARRLLSPEGDLLGLPIFIDSLALFYNKDVFESAGIAQPPANWDDLARVSRSLTRVAENNDVIRSGLALGSGSNVARSMEIASALILQKGDAIVHADGRSVDFSQAADQALGFYASFADPRSQNFSWTNRMPSSLEALATGKVAMAIGFARDIKRIRDLNPHLRLGVAPLPQPADSRVSRTGASYFFPTVSRLAKDPSTAWQFIFSIASGEEAKIYQKASARPPARRDIIAAGASNEVDTVFFKQALTARTWPIPDEAAVRRIFENALDALAAGTAGLDQTIGQISQRMSKLLR